MRKYKQILAAFLAINLTIDAPSIGTIKANASVEETAENIDMNFATDTGSMMETSGEIDTDTISYVETSDSTETSILAEASTSTEAFAGTEILSEIENPSTVETSVSAETSSSAEIAVTEPATEPVGTAPISTSEVESFNSIESSTTADITVNEENTEENVEDSTSTEESNTLDDEVASSEEESESEDVTYEQMEDFSIQANADGTLNLMQLAGYDDSKKTMTIDSNADLILLSNCDQSQVEDITINFVSVGEINVTEESKITSGTNISDYFKTAQTVVSDEGENQSLGDSETNNPIQIENVEQQEAVSQQGNMDDQTVIENSGTAVQSENFAANIGDDTQNIAIQSVSASKDYTYQGIGNAEHPFKGKITGTIPGAFKIDNSFFGGLSSSAKWEAENKTVTWCGKGAVPMIAKVYQFDSATEVGSSHTLPITIQGDGSAKMGSLIGTVKALEDQYKNQVLKIGADAVIYDDATVNATSETENSGLICNTLESGSICLDGYKFPTGAYTIESSASYNTKDTSAAGNAGGVIGVMKTGTKLEVKTAITISNANVNSSNGNAGGLVGLMEANTSIVTDDNAGVTLNNPSISGSISAGGIVGTAEDVGFADSDMLSTITVNSPKVTGNGENGAAVGGFIGKYTLNAASFATGSAEPSLSLPNKVEIKTPTLTVSSNGVAGGYFGHLNLNRELTYTIGNSDVTDKNIAPTYENCNAEAIGAIAGKVTSTDIASTLLIQNVSVSATNNSNSGIQRHGGLVGELGTKADVNAKAYLKVSNVEVKVKNPYAVDEQKDTTTNIEKGYGFGGIVGLLAQGSILQTENTVTISTEETAINRGGGLVGYAEKSVINVSGITDLFGTLYAKDSGKNSNDPKTGWLVGYQDSALIYANGDGNGNGWSYIRGKESGVTKQAMNDIGNYGQIIRLQSNDSSEAEKSKLSSDLITIDATNHAVSYKQNTAPTVNGDMITLNSVDAFARLSICWNTRGYFGNVAEIQQDVKPQSKNITLTSDVDLTGSGITGLSRDTYSDDDTYSGTFDGGSHTITLASGETFGFKDDKSTLAQAGDDGYGEVISAGASYHGRQGIFAKMSNATIQNLTVGGKIWISNNGSNDILVGGIAAELSVGSSQINMSGVTVKETITADGAGGSGLMLGGFFGGSYDPKIEVNLTDSNISNTVAVDISINGCPNDGTNDRRIIAGGVIGELGEQTFSFNVKSLTVNGSISTDAKKSAYIGGLIGAIKGNYESTNHYIKISNLVFNDFTINAETATDMSGGLFGSIWASVEVALQTPTDTDKYAVDVQNATINAKNATNVGGFAYRVGGKWEIQDRGINLNTFSISAKKDVGLLVCRGEQAEEQLSGGKKKIAALYLSTTKYWENSYKISENNVSVKIGTNGVFDEFVAYTTSASWNGTIKNNVSNILKNNQNGIISIATQDVTEDGKITRIGVDPSNVCTTYQNRTKYGKTKYNKWSRYYYDLDQCLKDIKADSTYGNNKNIDTQQELLVWSVYTYADDTLKKYFSSFPACTENQIKIGGDSTRANLDMKKYSYYPIAYTGGSVNVQKADIKFYNQEIENVEIVSIDKKSTQGQTASDYTQHYTMHCGLFLTYQSVNNTRAGAPLYVNDVTLSGSIGKVNNETSGALVADLAGGYDNMYSAININNTTLDNLKVNGCGEGYAPLLINRISLNLNLTVNTISTINYNIKGTPVASSLIGTVGSTTAENITMNFQSIKLPDKKADGTADGGIFSHATLLESYTYKKDSSTSNATYIFYYNDDWGEGKPHHDNVTYGKEITNSTEFAGIQKWYYDENLHGTDDGLVYDSEDNKSGFDARGYLPYVCVSYNEENCTHEIKVNQRVENILEGCGTYGHPYRITKVAEMNILSEYLSTGLPQKDWRVRVTKSQASVHTAKSNADYSSDEDVVYQYDGNGSWFQVENISTDGKTENWQSVNEGKNTLTKDFMLNYLLNAYYDIQGTAAEGSSSAELILNDFKGFGTETNPFRGVITSSNNTTLVLKGSRTGNGLIPYSYGSVVKNLKISYQKSDENQGKTLTYEASTTSNPKVAFGGVIGCVMGGDNIIDSVTVEMTDAYLTLSGDKSHLLQVGGYVGSVSGGGVIFRNMTDAAGLTSGKVAGLQTGGNTGADTNTAEGNKVLNLYVNPYVGRVLDGFAFYEKTLNADSVLTALDNTNKNYKINTLNAGTHLNVNDSIVTVSDAEGLLIFSAIVNSGAASGGNSLAYSRLGESQGTAVSYQDTGRNVTYLFGGKYGKVRNAAYSAIGTNAIDATDSVAEDQNLPGEGNLPYLIQTYGNKQTAIFSATTDSVISLSDTATGFEMTTYGNGYQGIGARYVSNAIRGYSTTSPTPVNNPENLVPEVKSFNGNNQTVTVAMQVSEYTDDDYPAASVGGIFNVLRVSGNETLSNVTIQQSVNSTSTQEDAASSEKTQNAAGISLTYYNSNGEKTDTTCSNNKEVGLGGFAGSLVGYTSKNDNRDITVSGIQINNLTIDSPASVGGIFGNVGKTAEHKNSNIAILLQPQDSQMTYGVAFNNCSYQNLNVTGKYAAGGFAGYIGNTDQNPKSTVNENAQTGERVANTMEDSNITATDYTSWAGGLFGYVKTRLFINMTDGGTKNDKSTVTLQNVVVSAGTAVGGCVGYIDTKRYGIYNVTVKGTNSSKVNISLNSTTTGTFYAGGIVGYAKGGWNDWHPDIWKYEGYIGGSSIENVQINTSDMAGKHDYNNTGEIKTNYITGGIAGQAAGGKTRMEGCTVTLSDIYGSVASGITGQTDSQMEFINCEVKGISEDSKTNIKGFSTAGGILGFWTGGQTGGQTVAIQGCKIQYLEVEGKDWGSGAIIGDAKSGGAGILYLFDTSAQDSTVTAAGDKDNGGGRWPCVGSIIGNLRNSIKASNVLISNVTLVANNGSKLNEKHGLLFGNFNSNVINIAGISIQKIPEPNKRWSLVGGGEIDSSESYIAFADYSGTALSSATTTDSQATDTQENSKTLLVGNSNDLLGDDYTTTDAIKTDVASPYVVTSPKSTLALYENETDTSSKYLYGDGVSWSKDNSDSSTATSFTVKAQEIYKARNSGNGDHYAYSNIPNTALEFNFTSVIATFSSNQTTENETNSVASDSNQPEQAEGTETDQTTQSATDFPVVQIGSGSTDVIADYLDILTNGAFTVANKLNTSEEVHVTAQSDVYEYKNGKFIKALDTSSRAFTVTKDSSNKISFATTTDYDNGKNRFNLLTVTFTEKDASGGEHHYNVFVPVLVRRMLEVDFSATLSYGTNFREENYKNLKSHVLESFGSSITAYLTYTYNSKEGNFAEYGWQGYINAGGDVATSMDRTICFKQGDINLPEGTQLSLVDCRDKKVYYYTVINPVKDIKLTEFKDSAGNTYKAPSIAELMKATAVQSQTGTFIKVDANGVPKDQTAEEGKNYTLPTVRIWNEITAQYEYYRLASSDENGAKYTITVNESNLKIDNKSVVSENYYLVITVPKDSNSGPLNGSLQTSIDNDNPKIPHQIHYRLIQGGVDDHNNKASTYLISKGYQQELSEETSKITDLYNLYKKMSASETTMKVDVVDKITFPNSQAYLDEGEIKDELYLRFVGSIQKTVNGSTSAEQFPSGTTGTANFYVYKNNGNTKTYYKYDSSNNTWSAAENTAGETIAASYTWTSDGGNMELPLADETIDNVISLQGVRQLVRGNQTSNDSTFYVEIRMDASIPVSGLDVIPESTEGSNGAPNDYAKLIYSSQISTEKDSIAYSTNRVSVNSTKVSYYREEPTGATLMYEADEIGQLGINLLDLQYLDVSREHSLIDTTAVYDLSSLKNLDDTLKKSSGIKFTLSLLPKNIVDNADQENYQEAIKSAKDYLDVDLKSSDSGNVEYDANAGSWYWVVPQSTYWSGNTIKTDSVFNGSILTQAIQLKVNVTNTETGHYYSNYKVVLTAEILDSNNNSISGTHQDDNIVYTLAKIKTEFVE